MPPRNGGSQSPLLSMTSAAFLLPWPPPPFASLRGVLSRNLIFFFVGILLVFLSRLIFFSKFLFNCVTSLRLLPYHGPCQFSQNRLA